MLDSIQFHNMTDESVKVIQWDDYKSIFLIVLLSICGLFNLVGKGLFIHFIWKWAPKGRPINFMFMKDQVVQVVTVTVCTFLTLASVITAKSIENLYGTETCWFLWICASLLNMSHSIGGLEMAIFRLICVKFQHLALDTAQANKLVMKIMLSGTLTMIPIMLISFTATSLAGSNMTLQFCQGQSKAFSEILSLYNGNTLDEIKTGFGLITLLFIIGQFIILAEFAIYAYLFYSLYQENKKSNVISKDVKKLRFKKNAITLSGQALGFAVESVGGILAQILLLSHIGGLETTHYTCLQILLVAIITISHFLASPELKRHYFHFDL